MSLNTDYRFTNLPDRSLGDGRIPPSVISQPVTGKKALSVEILRCENEIFEGTAGVSLNNRQKFLAAFFDHDSGVAVLSRHRDGTPAPLHMLDGLPEDWVRSRSASGRVFEIKTGVIAGFIHRENGRFYTRAEVEAAMRSIDFMP